MQIQHFNYANETYEFDPPLEVTNSHEIGISTLAMYAILGSNPDIMAARSVESTIENFLDANKSAPLEELLESIINGGDPVKQRVYKVLP